MKTLAANVIHPLTALTVIALAAPCASASITGVTGNTTWLGSPPASCTFGSLIGNNAFAWDEQQGVPISSGLNVDMVNNPGSSLSPIPGTISGLFDSHFIHFDGVPGVVGATGTVTFSGPILGVIFKNVTLDNSDFLGAGGTVYPTGYPFRGLSSNPLSFVTILGNTLTFNFKTIVPTNFIDQVRVITPHVPAPGGPIVLAAAGLAAIRRRRRA